MLRSTTSPQKIRIVVRQNGDKRHPESKATSIPVNINLAVLLQAGAVRITKEQGRSPFSKRITESPTIHSMGLSCENESNDSFG